MTTVTVLENPIKVSIIEDTNINIQIIESAPQIGVQVDNLRILKINSKTQAELIASATAGGLIAKELYFLTDINKIAYALTTSTYELVEADVAIVDGGTFN